jgi:phage-related protein
MADSAGMSIQPAEVADVSRQLDELASRVQRVMQDESANLTVTASGRDEVSQRVASTLNEVHTTFGASADQGLGEMHEVAATLRGHSENVVAADGDFIS